MNGPVIVKGPAITIKNAAFVSERRKKEPRRHKGGISALLYACQQGHVDIVRRILRTNTTALLETDRSGKTALHYCCISDNITSAQAADILVMAASDLVDKKDDEGFTPLHLAVIAGNLSLVTFLLANEADVHAVDNEKHTVVHWASVCGETAALRAVLEAGAPISTPDIHGGYPLHYAAQMCGDEKNSALGLEVLNTLLSQKNVDVSVEDNEKRQALLWAASAGSAKAILALARAGASVEAVDRDGLSALHCAASRGHTDCIDTLLTLCGATTDFIDSNGCTALHYAVTLGHADATALLLTLGADPNRQDRKGRSPAHCGCAKGQFETVKLLANHNGNLWLKNIKGDYPLHDAASSGRRELLKWLLDTRPSQVNAKNNDGRTPLHLAALNDNADMCKILLDAGADINPVLKTTKNVFMTPLDCALQRGFRSTAKFLQLHGGQPASRMIGMKQRNSSGGVSLQIRDDITLCSNSSSETEKEPDKIRRKKKSSFRRKLAYKYERMKSSISDSEYEERRQRKSHSGHIKQETNETNTGQNTECKDSFVQQNIDYQHSNKGLGGEIFIYANEVNISDKNNDVRIQQNGEIIVKHKEPADKRTEGSELKPTRPKSAKVVEEQKSDSNMKADSVSITKHKEGTDNVKTESTSYKQDAGKMVVSDEQSIMSNTSHEEDQHKELIVEASVHAPPKNKQGDINAQIVSIETADEKLKTEDIKSHTDETKTDEVEQLKEIKADTSELSIGAENVTSGKNLGTSLDESKPIPGADKEEVSESLQHEKNNTEQVKTASTETKELFQKENSSEKEIDEKDVETNSAEEAGNLQEPVISTNKMEVQEQTSTPVEVEMEAKAQDEQKPAVDKETRKSNLKSKQKREYIKTEKTKESPADSKSSTKEPTQEEPRETLKIDLKKQMKPKLQRSKSQIGDSKDVSFSSEISESDRRPRSLFASSSESISSVHKSFKVLDGTSIESQETKRKRSSRKKAPLDRGRSRSEEMKHTKIYFRDSESVIPKKTRIPMSVSHHKTLSKSERNLDKYNRHSDVSGDSRVPSLPNIYDSEGKSQRQSRSISNMSAPIFTSAYSDYDHESASEPEAALSSASKKKRFRKKSKIRGAKSAGSGYDSSNLIDSGFEPSPRSSRLPKWKNISNRGANMTSVTQSIQTNIRRYHLERKIFQHLLDLKRLQIRSGQHNEAVLVKRAIDAYHQSCAATVGAGRYLLNDYTFKSFEMFLYNSLRKIQRNGSEHLRGLPETPKNPLLCTQSTHRCDHAIHAYTGIPCAAYLPKMDHHTIPKIGFECKPQGFLPKINPRNTVTLELCHGSDKQIISLPAERLDQNKRYYVTFTVKGQDGKTKTKEDTNQDDDGHQHSKSI